MPHPSGAVLPTYAGKVDCVFIDPPYNTGNEGWCYNDNDNAPMAQRNGLIIETRPEQEIGWTNRVQAVCPEMPILLCTVKGPRQ